MNLLTDKGVYPYDYMNSCDKFDETKLPKKEDFYSQLHEENITDKDYARANIASSMKLFDEFGVENRKIVRIEEYPCQNRKQLEKKEGEYIGNDKSCLNRCIVGRAWMEYYDATGEHHLEQKK